jgi:hypothetical protein
MVSPYQYGICGTKFSKIKANPTRLHCASTSFIERIGSTNRASIKFWIWNDSVRTGEFKRSTRLRQGYGVAGAQRPIKAGAKYGESFIGLRNV